MAKNKRIDSSLHVIVLCNSNIYQMSTKIFESKKKIIFLKNQKSAWEAREWNWAFNLIFLFSIFNFNIFFHQNTKRKDHKNFLSLNQSKVAFWAFANPIRHWKLRNKIVINIFNYNHTDREKKQTSIFIPRTRWFTRCLYVREIFSLNFTKNAFKAS